MLRGLLPFRKYVVLGLALAAPIMGAGCDSCNTAKVPACPTIPAPAPCAAPAPVVKTLPCATPAPIVTAAPCGRPAPCVKPANCARPQRCAYRTNPGRRVAAATPCSTGVVMPTQLASAPVAYTTPGAVIPTYLYGNDTGSVTYKPIASRSIHDALANVDANDAAFVRTSSAGSSVVSSVITPTELTAAVAAPAMAIQETIPAGYVIAEAPAQVVVAPRRQSHQRRVRAPRHSGQVVPVARPVATAGIPTGTPVYITPGGTAVTGYVPAPASGTYLDGAAPTGYLPVTERRGPDGAVIHYATRSICKYDPKRGEDCVWTSGF